MMVLDSEQISHFNREGFLVVRNAIDPTLLKPINKPVNALVSSGPNPEFRRLDVHRDDRTVLVWMKDIHYQIPSLATLLHHKSLGSMAAQLLNESVEVRLLLDALFYKSGQNGGAVGWHQDYSYWQHVEPVCSIAAWIALTDSCEENGCLKVIPGSHKWGLMPGNWTNAFSEDPDELLKHPQVKAEQGEVQPQSIELKVGDVSFHHSLTMHGSYANRTQQERIGYTVQYIPSSARYNQNKVRFWQRDPQLIHGGAFRSDRHPVLWRS